MRFCLRLIVLAVALLSSQVLAQDLDAGLEAFEAGDYETALNEWKPLAEQGSAEAQFNLGTLYFQGKGVRADPSETAKWDRKAAKQGFADAQIRLGISYFMGSGVPQDFITAHMWLNLAAAQGGEFAISSREAFADILSPDQTIEAQRRAKVCLASGYKDCE